MGVALLKVVGEVKGLRNTSLVAEQFQEKAQVEVVQKGVDMDEIPVACTLASKGGPVLRAVGGAGFLQSRPLQGVQLDQEVVLLEHKFHHQDPSRPRPLQALVQGRGRRRGFTVATPSSLHCRCTFIHYLEAQTDEVVDIKGQTLFFDGLQPLHSISRRGHALLNQQWGGTIVQEASCFLEVGNDVRANGDASILATQPGAKHFAKQVHTLHLPASARLPVTQLLAVVEDGVLALLHRPVRLLILIHGLHPQGFKGRSTPSQQ